jgi:hypothetical protein
MIDYERIDFEKTIWVNGKDTWDGGSDNWPGTKELPLKTLDKASGIAASLASIKIESLFDKIKKFLRNGK